MRHENLLPCLSTCADSIKYVILRRHPLLGREPAHPQCAPAALDTILLAVRGVLLVAGVHLPGPSCRCLNPCAHFLFLPRPSVSHAFPSCVTFSTCVRQRGAWKACRGFDLSRYRAVYPVRLGIRVVSRCVPGYRSLCVSAISNGAKHTFHPLTCAGIVGQLHFEAALRLSMLECQEEHERHAEGECMFKMF